MALENWPDRQLDTTLDLEAKRLENIHEMGVNCRDTAMDLQLAEAWHQLGNRFYNAERYQGGLHCFQKALSLRSRLLDAHHKDMLRSYTMIGTMHNRLKDHHTALTYFDSAGVWTPESAGVLHVYNLMMTGIAYLDMKEPSRSKMYLQMAVDSIQTSDNGANRWFSEVLIQYSSCHRMMGQFREAIEKGNESLKWAGANSNPVRAEASAYLAIGNAYQDSAYTCADPDKQLKAFQLAIYYTEKARELYQTLPNTEGLVILTTGNIGELHRRAGQYDKALNALSAVLDSQSSQNSAMLSQLYINRGETWMDKSQLEKAMTDFNAALHCLVPASQPWKRLPPANAPSNDRFELMNLLGDIAATYLNQSATNPACLDSAATTFDTLLTLLNLIRSDFLSDEAKIELAGDSRNILDKAFGGYLMLYRNTNDPKYLERAFDISEQRKSFALLEAARLNNADAALPENLRQKKRRLARTQSDIEQGMVSWWDNPDSIRALTNANVANQAEARLLQQEIKTGYPDYYRLKQKGADLDIRSIRQEMLGKDQALIEYFCRDTALSIFLVTPGRELQYFESPIHRDSLSRLSDAFIQLSARPGTGGETDAGREEMLCAKAHQLYRILLGSLPADLPERLILIPDAPFLTLPFEALSMLPAPGDIHRQVANKNFVLFKHCVSYCFSANLLREMQQSRAPSGLDESVAAFAPHFPEQLKTGSNLPEFFRQTVQNLTPLGNKREVEAIAALVPLRPFVDAAASKQHFWEACQHHAFVHVATHGVLNQDPNLNFIAFSQNGDSLDQHELLFLHNLYAEHLPQELIVFSACETTLGQYREGEGNISMARGLAYSGVRSFITTLWKVSTDANRQIMPGFYRFFLNEKEPKDVALTKARRDFILSSPDNEQLDQWAGLVLIGSSERSAQRRSVWWLAAAGVCLVLFLSWKRWRSSKQE